MALENHLYDKVKILHELSRILWFIKKYAVESAKNDKECLQLLKQIETDLSRHIDMLKQMTCK
jgi:hypothetical protein